MEEIANPALVLSFPPLDFKFQRGILQIQWRKSQILRWFCLFLRWISNSNAGFCKSNGGNRKSRVG
jgi:hypothetical protein